MSRFEEIVQVWLEKAHTLLKSVACAVIEHDGTRRLHPKRAGQAELAEKVEWSGKMDRDSGNYELWS